MSMLLQIVTGSTSAADTATMAQPMADMPPQETLSLLDFITKGGLIMIPIVLLLFWSVYILIERLMAISKASKIDDRFMDNIKDFVHNNNVEAASTLCKTTSNPHARMIGKGVSKIGKPIKEIKESMEDIGRLEINRLEKNLSVLSVIAGVAPMFGFVGTIIGVIKIFYNIALADNISIGLIAGGLYEKMITSAGGLIVGIFAFAAYHILNGMVNKMVTRMEINSIEFVEVLEQPGK